MCIIFVALHQHPKYPIIVIANRDEVFRRPTEQANTDWFGGRDIIAGHDIQAGGTWLGVTVKGKFAAITNFREPKESTVKTSRGHLVIDFLKSDENPIQYLSEVSQSGASYLGYNLLVADKDDFAYYSNVKNVDPETLEKRKLYGLSNALLDTPWPKVNRGKEKLSSYLQSCSNDDVNIEELFKILHDEQKAPESELPNTGVPVEWESYLSSIFVSTSSEYGTRCSSIYLVDGKQHAIFVERTHLPDGSCSDRKFEFSWNEASL